MRFQHDATINAPISTVWEIYSDVEHWPDWTESIRSVELVPGHELAVGSRAKIKQPKLPTAVWQVTYLQPGRSWTWVATAPGVRTTATHELEAVDPQTTRVRMGIVQEGIGGALIGRLYAGLTRRYLDMEARGLAQRSEARTRS